MLCEFTAEGFLRHDGESAAKPIPSAEFNIPLAVAASSAFPPLFPPIRVDANRCRISRQAFGVDVDHLSDGGVYDNLGMNAAMSVLRSSSWWGIRTSL